MLNNIFIVLGVSVAINALFFSIAFTFKSDIFTDITYSATFFIVTLIVMIINSSYNITSYLVLTIIGLWSLRLGSYLFIRIRKIKVDHRFDNMRDSFWKFGGFWLLQAITVWLVNMPGIIVMINNNDNFDYYSIIFFVLAIGFLLYETIADLQKWRFINKGTKTFINTGLWKSSRHPNYFGEIMFWWSLTAFVLFNQYEHINNLAFIGPVWITLMINYISGVPLLEKQTLKLFGDDPKYHEYLKNTPCVIPYIGRK